MCISYNCSSGDNNFMNLLKSTSMLGILVILMKLSVLIFYLMLKLYSNNTDWFKTNSY